MPRNTQVARILLVLRRLETQRGATLEELTHARPADSPGNLRAMRRDVAAEARKMAERCWCFPRKAPGR